MIYSSQCHIAVRFTRTSWPHRVPLSGMEVISSTSTTRPAPLLGLRFCDTAFAEVTSVGAGVASTSRWVRELPIIRRKLGCLKRWVCQMRGFWIHCSTALFPSEVRVIWAPLKMKTLHDNVRYGKTETAAGAFFWNCCIEHLVFEI